MECEVVGSNPPNPNPNPNPNPKPNANPNPNPGGSGRPQAEGVRDGHEQRGTNDLGACLQTL